MFTSTIKGLAASLGRQWVGFMALFFVLSTGSAYALAGHNTVRSDDIVNGTIKSIDLRDGGVAGVDILDGGVTGADVDESSLTTVPDANTLAGRSPSSFASSSVYKKESAVEAGTDHGDGTFIISVSCDPGDILLTGGPANVNATSDMVESLPSPGTTNGWTARINKHGVADNFSVVILCIDQA